ncbi:hypothetical protein [Streptomyces sp. NPDC001315]|uniref:hypothetical protein n=1 Tax=Streptomyces sp. NPDC001315 TaxID=3364562 RepID=UPI0036B41621
MNAAVPPGSPRRPATGGPDSTGPLCGELLQLCRGAGLRLGPGPAGDGLRALSEQLADQGCCQGPDTAERACGAQVAERLALLLRLGSDDAECRVLAGLNEGLRALLINGCGLSGQ